MRVKFIKTHENAKIPVRSTPGSAGYDVYAVEDTYIAPGKVALVSSGLKIALPFDYEAQVRPRSSLALKHGVTVLNAPGTIDPDYRGDLGVILINHGSENFVVRAGDRIAQLVFAPIVTKDGFYACVYQGKPELKEVDQFDETERGEGGFGSTGR